MSAAQLEALAGATVISDLPDAEYHSHKGSLSASGAKWLAPPNPCPAKFRHYRDHPQTKAVFDFGHVAHRLVLGKGADFEVVQKVNRQGEKVDAGDYDTKSAQEHAAQIRAADKTPVLREQLTVARELAEAVKADPIAAPIFSDGEAEVSLFWPDEEYPHITRRARFDWLTNARDGRRRIIADLKTTRTAEPLGFGKSAADYGYAISAANYVDGAIACGLDPDPAFLLIAVEKVEPYVVTVFQVPDAVIELGRHLMGEAIRLYAECLATDTWPGYSTGIEQLQLPGWYVNRIEDSLT